MRSLLNEHDFPARVIGSDEIPWPLPNVWLGVSAENQQWADIRIPDLLETPAAVLARPLPFPPPPPHPDSNAHTIMNCRITNTR